MRRLPTEILLFALAICLGRSPLVSANTQIVNFGVVPSLDVPLPLPHSTAWLSLNNSEQLFAVVPAPLGTALADVCAEPGPEPNSKDFGACPHELWLSIGTDEPAWAACSTFTLRISWPASSPADFHIDTYSPLALRRLIHRSSRSSPSPLHPQPLPGDPALTRRTYARIRVVSSGVLTPTHAHRHRHPTPEPVRFMVAVEPLHFGVLPGSVVPTVLAIVAVATVAGLFVVPLVTKRLAAIASEVRAEVASQQARKSQ